MAKAEATVEELVSKIERGELRLPEMLPDALHREEVVEDHPLGAITRWAAAADHRLGHIPRCRGPLHLRRGDRILHQRAQQVAISGGAGGHGFRSHHAGARLPIDLVQPLQQHRRLGEPERLAITGQQRQRGGPPRELLRQPPLFMAQTLGRCAVAQLIPMQVAISSCLTGQQGEQRLRLLQPAAALQQLLDGRGSAGQPGGQALTSFILASN